MAEQYSHPETPQDY